MLIRTKTGKEYKMYKEEDVWIEEHPQGDNPSHWHVYIGLGVQDPDNPYGTRGKRGLAWRPDKSEAESIRDYIYKQLRNGKGVCELRNMPRFANDDQNALPVTDDEEV